jgi:acetyltransferase-like isoleucine patch superfamily enzyme
LRSRLKSMVVISYELIMQAIFSLPRFRVFNVVKTLFLRMVGANVGDRVVFYPRIWIAPGRNLSLGSDVDLALDVLISTAGGVEIGDRTLVGYRTQIISANHKIGPLTQSILGSGHERKKVTIGRDCWIGGNCMILPGVTIGDGAVVAAGSVVTKDIPTGTIAAGVPARIIRERRTS